MIDITFSGLVGNMLDEIKGDLNSDDVIAFSDFYLNHGKLDCDIFSEQAKISAESLKYCYVNVIKAEQLCEYEECLHEYQKNCSLLKEYLSNGQKFRLWLNNSAQDRCCLLWFCSFLNGYKSEVEAIYCPNYYNSHTQPFSNRVWGLTDPQFMLSQVKNAHKFSNEEMDAYSFEWERIVKENAELRILMNDEIIGVEESFFDGIILGFVKETPQTQRTIMGNYLGKWMQPDAAFISKRIEHLIEIGIIQICETSIDKDDCYWDRTLSLKPQHKS